MCAYPRQVGQTFCVSLSVNGIRQFLSIRISHICIFRSIDITVAHDVHFIHMAYTMSPPKNGVIPNQPSLLISDLAPSLKLDTTIPSFGRKIPR